MKLTDIDQKVAAQLVAGATRVTLTLAELKLACEADPSEWPGAPIAIGGTYRGWPIDIEAEVNLGKS